MGVDPGPFTARELMWMAEGKQRDAWQRESHLLCLLANAHRNTKKQRRPYKPVDFYPFRLEEHEKPGKQVTDIKEIMSMFPGGKPGGAKKDR